MWIFAGMNTYTGIYYLKDGPEHSATFSFLNDKLSIQFTDEDRTKREVYWYYDEINKEELKQGFKPVIGYKGYPEQIIEVNSTQFSRELEEYINRQRKNFLLNTFGHSLPFLRILFTLIILLAAVYLWLVPYLAVRLAEKVPVSYEENLGNGMYNAMKSGFTIDEKKSVYSNEFFSELNISTPYTIHVTVVKDNIVNAFAMPGGNIILYDKIIAGMDNYKELAALLSHEFSHVQNKHTTKSLFRQMGNTVFLSVLFGNTSAMSNVIIRNADNLKSLSYGRNLEKEADKDGLKILSDRKIDGDGFVNLFEMLKKQGGLPVSEWMSSHPDLDRRIEYIKGDPLFNKNGVQESETLRTLFGKIKAAG
jgi:beta-barrel assembly-enhancing protease